MTAKPVLDDGNAAAFRGLAADFARGAVTDARPEADRGPFAPPRTDILDTMASLGFFAVNLPVDRGGLGLDAAALCPIVEEISRVDAGFAAALFASAAALEVIACASRITGERPGEITADDGALPLAFTAFRHPDEGAMPFCAADGRLTGPCELLSLAGSATRAVILARGPSDDAAEYRLVDLRDGGVVIKGPVFTLGLRSCPSCDIELNDTPSLPLGGPGTAIKMHREMTAALAPLAAALSLGIMKGSFDCARAYAGERRQGGRVIARWPEVKMMLASMAVEIENAVAALEGALLSGKGGPALALRCGESACRVTSDGVQVLGGNGYMRDYFQEKRMRDAAQARFLLGNPYLRKCDIMDSRAEEER